MDQVHHTSDNPSEAAFDGQHSALDKIRSSPTVHGPPSARPGKKTGKMNNGPPVPARIAGRTSRQFESGAALLRCPPGADPGDRASGPFPEPHGRTAIMPSRPPLESRNPWVHLSRRPHIGIGRRPADRAMESGSLPPPAGAMTTAPRLQSGEGRSAIVPVRGTRASSFRSTAPPPVCD